LRDLRAKRRALARQHKYFAAVSGEAAQVGVADAGAFANDD
jgi:hypothetical protein